MLTEIDTNNTHSALNTAPVDNFTLLRPQALSGDRLAQIDTLQRSLTRFGLLSPLVVMQRGAELVVVDGRKRLAALRRLAFEGRLPRSLRRIPFILVDREQPNARRSPVLLRNRVLYQAIAKDQKTGRSIDMIAKSYSISRQCVRDVLTLTRLSAPLRARFFKGDLDFAQARAYAAHPDSRVQYAIFCELGRDAEADTIRRIVSLSTMDETNPAETSGLTAHAIPHAA